MHIMSTGQLVRLPNGLLFKSLSEAETEYLYDEIFERCVTYICRGAGESKVCNRRFSLGPGMRTLVSVGESARVDP